MEFFQDIDPFKNQIFEQIKWECLSSGKLFVDQEFPPDLSSLAKFKYPYKEIVWKRPFDLVENPEFFVDGADPNDFEQGEIGDCWFIAAAIAITAYPEHLQKVVPRDQSFTNDYCGIFHFRFWKYGKWYDVVVDDLLPVTRHSNQLIYSRNKRTKNEFWCCLFEKAYAKMATCYEFLDGGFTEEAMIDLTGGINERFQVDRLRYNTQERNSFWNLLIKAHSMKSLMGASINQVNGREAVRYNGLVEGHAYSITKIIEVNKNNSFYGELESYLDSISYTVRLIRLKNPWSNHVEWKGRFSDNSSEWNFIPSHIKDEIGLIKEDDGEFWFENFLNIREFI